ncbi:MAG: glycosyltransferase family 2 protein, partial [Anaerolineales bacterium]
KDQAECAIKNFCQYSDDILFSSSPFDYKEATHFNVQPPEYWASVFARYGFYRDVDFDGSFITPWTVRFRRLREPIQRVITAYERKHWLLLQDNTARRQLDIQLRSDLAEKEHQIRGFESDIAQHKTKITNLEGHLDAIFNSNSWRLIQRFQRIREWIVPPGSQREDFIASFFRALKVLRKEGVRGVVERVSSRVSWRTKVIFLGVRYRFKRSSVTKKIEVPAVVIRPDVQQHKADVDIVICVHNALPDVKRCLESVVRNTSKPYRIIILDDGSQSQTRDFLLQFSKKHDCDLLRNEQAGGYTRAANRGLQNSKGEYVVLLNSDTIVTPNWVDRMVACAEKDENIGLVGPLSNTASWQSIPEYESDGDWAENPLPDDVSVDEMGELVSRSSARLYPEMPFLNGFCLMIRRSVIDQIGYFDEENFGEGYGEENDYCLRVRKAGFKLELADDTYIFHAQSRSYNHERRKQLSKRAAEILARKYGQTTFDQGVRNLRDDRVFVGIRARARQIFSRRSIVHQGQNYTGRKVLFILPIKHAGGGGNIVVNEARAMLAMAGPT